VKRTNVFLELLQLQPEFLWATTQNDMRGSLLELVVGYVRFQAERTYPVAYFFTYVLRDEMYEKLM